MKIEQKSYGIMTIQSQKPHEAPADPAEEKEEEPPVAAPASEPVEENTTEE